MRAAVSIDRYLRGEDLKAGREEEIKLAGELSKEDVEKKWRLPMPILQVGERVGNFNETELGFTEEMALQEAERCLSCGGCSECLECEKACEAKAIIHDQNPETVNVNVGAIILTPGFEEFDPHLKSEYGYGRYPNVVSSIEFERMMNASGPSAGRILRPSDGKIPRKVAFVQCVGSRDAQLGNRYCSSACCMYSIKESVIAKEHTPDLASTIFFMDMRAYGKEFDVYYDRAEREYGVKFVRSRVASVTEDTLTGNLSVQYVENEDPKTEEFDLVVLAVGICPPAKAAELAEILGIKLNKYNFCQTEVCSPVETSRPGVFVSGAFSSPKDIPESVAQASGAAAKAMGLIASERGKEVVEKQYPPERDVSKEEPRIGVFVCHCGTNIGGVVRVSDVVEYARTLPNVVYAEENLYTCSQDTQEAIKGKIKEHNLNRVVVASCTPRTHEPLFKETVQEAGLNPYLFHMANIRDQCSWVHMHEPEKATEKSEDLLRAAVAKARLMKPLEKPVCSVIQAGLVIGGGLSGMTAALELAKQGFEVHLVEKEKELGGQLRSINYLLESTDPQELLKSTVRKVWDDEKIHVHVNAQINDVEGYIGNFKTTICSDERREQIQSGIIIVATGATKYRPTEYLYGVDPKVITQHELEEKIVRKQFKAKTVVMIQCVGARNETRPNCARICCAQAIKNALKIKELFPKTEVYVLYKDIRTYGFKEDYYRDAAEKGVLFLRYDNEHEPKAAEKGVNLVVSAWEPVLKTWVRIKPDLLALSVATVPNDDNERLAKLLKVPLTKDGFFLEAHVKLRPLDFATDGIFLCGLAHWPKLIEESIAQASGAAARAAVVLSKKTVEVEGITASVDKDLCVSCGLCTTLCPYGAIEKDENGIARVNDVLCKGCGLCAASCPQKSIDMKHFSDAQVLAEAVAALGGS
jgi:heterodisulfide reductase subunit A-like polyferredoxin